MSLKRMILNIAATLALVLTPSMAAMSTASAAGAPCGNSPAAQQVLGGLDQTGNNCGDEKVNNLFQTVVQIMTIIVGVASVLVILYAGFKYITSSGEQGRVANAKSTLIYAVVGLAVAAFAQLMIHFVLARTS